MCAFFASRRNGRFANARRGFSLVEMLVVLAIIGTLIGLVLMVCLKVVSETTHTIRYVSQQTMDLAAISDTPLHIPAPGAPPRGPDKLIPDQYIVEFDGTVANPDDAAAKLIAAFGGGRIIHIYDTPESKGCNVFIPGTGVPALQAHPGVSAVEQDQVFRKCADTFPTGIRRIGSTSNINRKLPQFSPSSVGLTGVNGTLVRKITGRLVIAVMDTGVDATHPDLNVTFARAFGAAFAPVTDDVDGHGTHVAGTIGAKINDSGVVGMVPNVEIWNIRVLDDLGVGTTGDIIAGVNFVRTAATIVRVLNMSLGGPTSGALDTACNNCANAGIMVCVAAGNDSDDARFSSPARAQRVVCVAALADSDGKFGGQGPRTSAGPDDTFADFSNFGQVVDVIAPGTDILSTQPLNSFAVFNGTSMACPHVAGILALYSDSFIIAQNGTQRPARGLELVSLFIQRGSAELIRGPSGGFGSRNYPMLLDKLTKKP